MAMYAAMGSHVHSDMEIKNQCGVIIRVLCLAGRSLAQWWSLLGELGAAVTLYQHKLLHRVAVKIKTMSVGEPFCHLPLCGKGRDKMRHTEGQAWGRISMSICHIHRAHAWYDRLGHCFASPTHNINIWTSMKHKEEHCDPIRSGTKGSICRYLRVLS